MLKKSLKIGSILLLIFAMAAFMGCDTGSGDTDPDDTPVGPVDPDPGKPDPVEPEPPKVTGVTITPADPETLSGVLAGKSYLFYAKVNGTAADKTVTWTVAIADADYYHDKPEDGTGVSNRKQDAGLLKIDAGESPGTILTVKAVSTADPSVSGEVTVTVVKPGPRLMWTPNGVAVTTLDEGAVDDTDGIPGSVGRLFDIYQKDIRILDGEYIEGQHYTVRRVDQFNQTLSGGTIAVSGNADEGTISVALSGNVVGRKGPIGITLYPSVLEGADAALIDLEGPGAEMVFNVTAANLIIDLIGLPDIPTPLTGEEKEDTLGDPTSTTDRMSGTITWKGLSGIQYTHRSQAVATLAINAMNGYTFYDRDGYFDPLVKSKFKNGSPDVVLTSKSPSRLVVTLTYNVTAVVIDDPDSVSVNGTGANFTTYLHTNPLVVNGLVTHEQTAPEVLRTKDESPYYFLDQPVVWTGLSGKTFFGGKTAVATVTIPAKPGYTFEGTTLTNDTLKELFTTTQHIPAADIISAGDSLVFTLSYYVQKTDITDTIITNNIIKKLPIPVVGVSASGKDLQANKTADFKIETVELIGVGSKFEAGQTVGAKVIFTANDGYKFADALTPSDGSPVSLTAGSLTVDGTITPSVVMNLGSKLECFITLGSTRQAIPANIGIVFTGVPIIHGQPIGAPSFPVGTYVTASGATSSFSWGSSGRGHDGTNFAWDGSGSILTRRVLADVVLVPGGEYTFAGVNPTTYRTYLLSAFVSNGVSPAIDTIAVNGHNLTFTLSYPIGKVKLANSDITVTDLFSGGATAGDLVANITVNTSSITAGDKVAVKTQGWDATSYATGSTTNFASTGGGNKATYTLVLEPFEDHDTFLGTDLEDWETEFAASTFSTSNPSDVDVTIGIGPNDDTLTVKVIWDL
jgi:hypothetical protein